MSRATIGGAGALLVAPLLALVGVLVQPTLSDDAGDLATAIIDHRPAMQTGIALQTIAIVLLIGGAIWLALTLVRHAPGLATAGGILAVLGSLIVLFEQALSVAGIAMVDGLGSAQATASLDRLHSSAAVSGLEPLSLLGDIGLALLGLAVVRAGASRLTAVAIVVGAFGEGAGFATGTTAVTAIAFAILFVGLAQAVRTLVGRRASRVAPEVAPGY